MINVKTTTFELDIRGYVDFSINIWWIYITWHDVDMILIFIILFIILYDVINEAQNIFIHNI